MNETGDKLSPKAQKALESLSEAERRVIRKNNPLRAERNEAIRSLSARGLTQSVLAELTGLGHSAIRRILKPKTVHTATALSHLARAIEGLRGAAGSIHSCVLQLMKYEKERR
ncbi:MAG: hypothetical protein SWQ30_14335 [Thermodesulfobacteriota bacterium]|nr:hypothetical protein [Thermodesulfobacteriota bacterium]